MDELIWLDNARMWLTNEAHERRRNDLLLAVAYLLVAIGSVVLGLWLLGTPITAGLLVIMGVLYLVYGRFRTEAPVISAETSRPRTLGVIRNASLTRNAYKQVWFDWSYILGFLMAPIHLVVEAGRLMRRRAALVNIETDAIATVFAMLAERRCAIALEELSDHLPDAEAAITQLHDLRGVVILRNPDRISLTDPVVDEIRTE